MTVVAVTGARGFLGQHTVADLERAGHIVVGIGRGEDGSLTRLSGPPTATGSLFDGVDAVVHLASLLSLGPDSNVADYLEVNVALSERLVRDAAAAGAASFVFASSRLVYPADLGGKRRRRMRHPTTPTASASSSPSRCSRSKPHVSTLR